MLIFNINLAYIKFASNFADMVMDTELPGEACLGTVIVELYTEINSY